MNEQTLMNLEGANTATLNNGDTIKVGDKVELNVGCYYKIQGVVVINNGQLSFDSQSDFKAHNVSIAEIQHSNISIYKV